MVEKQFKPGRSSERRFSNRPPRLQLRGFEPEEVNAQRGLPAGALPAVPTPYPLPPIPDPLLLTSRLRRGPGIGSGVEDPADLVTACDYSAIGAT